MQQQCHLAITTIQGWCRGKYKQVGISKQAKLIDHQVEDAMDVVERGDTYLRKATMYWNIPLTSLSNHLNGRTRCRKVGLQGVLTK
jgi:hypothetical protein